MRDYETFRIIRGLPKPEERVASALAIGNFDGLHLGHAALLKHVSQIAREKRLVPTALTFEPHPREFFKDSSVRLISTLRDRCIAILRCGIKRIHILPFDAALAGLSPETFARKILLEGLNAQTVGVGENFTFGAKGAGTPEVLTELGQKLGFEVLTEPLLTIGNETVSSTRIRDALESGDLRTTELLFGHPYQITGRVVHGSELGRTLGFPTLNIDILPPGSISKPALRGVFAVMVSGVEESGKTFAGVASLGVKPTVTSEARWLLEVNVFDWSGNAYGRMVKVTFVQKLRDEKKFSGLTELKDAIARDALSARNILSL